MKTGLLHSHSLLAWVLMGLALVAIVTSLIGWFGKKPFTSTNSKIALFLTITADIQLLIGLVMYFATSEITKMAFQDFGAAMKTPELRFYAVEHILIMIIAIALLHIGKVKAKKAATDIQKHKISAIFYTIATVLLLSRVPWDRLIG